eukprot:3031564-Pyramimonas_sp.AAC.1
MPANSKRQTTELLRLGHTNGLVNFAYTFVGVGGSLQLPASSSGSATTSASVSVQRAQKIDPLQTTHDANIIVKRIEGQTAHPHLGRSRQQPAARPCGTDAQRGARHGKNTSEPPEGTNDTS